ncbi:MAG TPA: NAD-dependent deacylase [Thermoplasmata archaeon]|nr:NAD-dependent deacylase [Thermoplasmata archaeon]
MKLTLEEARKALKRAEKVAVLTGAGISAESGIPIFRGKDGLWQKHEIEKVATLTGFLADPDYAWKFHSELMKIISKAKPNRAHYVLAEMEPHFPEFHVITQNVDNLHQEAGSKNVIELHGNIWRVKCLEEEKIYPVKKEELEKFNTHCPKCGGLLKPDVVFFGEPLPKDALGKALTVSAEADVMFVVGTSAVVQPAASLPFITKENRGLIFEFNPETTALTKFADFSLKEPATKGLDLFWKEF